MAEAAPALKSLDLNALAGTTAQAVKPVAAGSDECSKSPSRPGRRSGHSAAGGSPVVAWHRRYNVSGTAHCGDRLEDWCRVLRTLLGTADVGTIGHYSGAVSVFASSPVADLVSCGFERNDVCALASGHSGDWVHFRNAMRLGTRSH